MPLECRDRATCHGIPQMSGPVGGRCGDQCPVWAEDRRIEPNIRSLERGDGASGIRVPKEGVAAFIRRDDARPVRAEGGRNKFSLTVKFANLAPATAARLNAGLAVPVIRKRRGSGSPPLTTHAHRGRFDKCQT
jgi:hypothetical protein